MANMGGSRVGGSGDAGKNITLSDAVKTQIKQDAKGTLVGGKVVRSITWAAGATMFEQLGNYIKSCYDDDYAQSMRDAFFQQMQKKVSKATALPDDQPKTFDSIIKDIKDISNEDLSETRKHQLILQAYDMTKATEAAEATEDANDFIDLWDNQEAAKNLDQNEDQKKANEYFKTEKTRILNSLRLKQVLDTSSEISTEQGLKDLVKTLIEEKVTECNNVDDLKSLEKQIIKFINEEKAVAFSPEEKEKLIALALYPLKKEETMQGVAKMLEGTLGLEAAKDPIQTIHNNDLINRQLTTDEDLKNFQKECIQAGVNAMMEASRGSAKNLSTVETNVREFLDKGSPTALSEKDKEDLIETVMIAEASAKVIEVATDAISATIVNSLE